MAGGKAQADNCVWAACVRKESFSDHLLQGTGEMLDTAVRAEERLAGSGVPRRQRGRAGAGTWAALRRQALVPAPSLASRENALSPPQGHAFLKAHPFFMLSPLASRVRLKQIILPGRPAGSHKCF